ncbi:MAG: hypothetical protein JF626_04070 [Polaromonas sp.]|nr:hypothetical protein [Polaromonas sp.]
MSAQALGHDHVFHKTFDAARRARARRVKVRPHRAITPLRVTPYLAAQAIILPLLFCGALLWTKPLLLDFWRNCILWWSAGLDLPFSLASRADEAGEFSLAMGLAGDAAPLPGQTTLVITALVTLAVFALSLRMKDAKLPLKYPIRIVCVLQFVALGYFRLSPSSFPYSISRHSEELMTIGYGVMVATPVMLAMGYYILNQSLLTKLLHTALILGFFTILIPHQVLAQAFIMQHLSVLFMPVLYLCFGAVFDALVFVALYSWAVSNAPMKATT